MPRDKVEELRKLAVAIANDPHMVVEIDNRLATAHIAEDDRTIRVTKQLLPKELWNYPYLIDRFFDGLVLHEAGHKILTCRELRNVFYDEISQEKGSNLFLEKICQNLVEDARVDYYLISRYQLDLGKRVTFSNELIAKSLESTIKLGCKTGKFGTDPKKKIQRNNLFVCLLTIRAIYDNPLTELESKLTHFDRENLEKATSIIKESRFIHHPAKLKKQYWKLYRILENYADGLDLQSVPRPLGWGSLECSKDLKEMAGKIESELKKGEVLEEKTKKTSEYEQHLGVGMGDGKEIPPPPSNIEDYNRRLTRLTPIINELLKKLKLAMRPRLKEEKFRKSGRLMTEVIGKAYSSSFSRKVEDIYKGYKRSMEKTPILAAVIVDISGSMSLAVSKDICTILMEVLGRWLRDSDFMLVTFESSYTRIKTFKEAYHNTRYRIGGFTLAHQGGTQLKEPLIYTYKAIRAIRDPTRKKLVIIASDFQFGPWEISELSKIITSMRAEGIGVVGIGLCYCRESLMRELLEGNCTRIKYLEELPEKIVDIYMETVKW